MEDTVAAVMKDTVDPGAGGIATHVEENGLTGGELRQSALEVRSGGHELGLFDEPNITPRGSSGTKYGQLLNWHTNNHFLYHLCYLCPVPL